MFLKKIKGGIVLTLFCFMFLTNNVLAQEDPSSSAKEVNIYLFYSETCSHCAEEKEFLNKLIEADNRIKFNQFEVTKNKENEKLFKEVADKLNVPPSDILIPFTVIGDSYFVGWISEESTGKQIEKVIYKALEDGCTDIVKNSSDLQESCEQTNEKQQFLENISLPLFGEVDFKNVSLPVLTFIIAFLDGFNPCAMWTLIFLISLLLGMKDRKKMWILGTAFIAASAFVYFLFLSAWLNLFMFLGLIASLRIFIGIVAVGTGGYNLKKYFTQPAGVCSVTGGQKSQKVFEKLKMLIQEKSFFIALIGIIILAFVVNLVELVCSAGLPAVYIQVLTLSDLPTYQYYSYITFYILIFMLDDLFVFFVAMTTLKLTGVNAKYSKISELVGGIIMLIIGVLLVLRPEWLSFGM
ncbi:MAG: hypothetical protein KAT32_02680 [Candidatus Moranbacteria bacterium]|nr:hypothetical protein [Candidatus Moranbacteria bacterium]